MLSDLERTKRLDSEFYGQNNIQAFNRLVSLQSLPITDFVTVSDGNHMSISDYYCEDGVPYYRGTDIYNFFIEHASNPLAITDAAFNIPNMKRSHLKQGDVLMSIVGAIIGNLSLVTTHDKATCSCKLAIMRPTKIEPSFLAMYLKSFYGQNQIQKFKRGGSQTGLLLEDFNQILIPHFSEVFRLQIVEVAQKAYELLDDSKNIYTQAETLLLKTLEMVDFMPISEAVNIKSFNESFGASGRLDAEYYQPKYEDFERHVLHSQLSHTTVKAQFNLIKESSKRLKQGYQYVEIGDVNVDDGKANTNFVDTESLPANAKIEAKYGDVLVSKVRPNRGAIAIVDFDDTDLIVSGAFTVLRAKPDGIMSVETLKVLLRTKMYREWLLKFNVGTSYPVIRDDDVLDLPIPIVHSGIQRQIADLVQQSFALKVQSAHLLDVAKRAVEMAIEQDETAAMTHIEREA